MKYGRILRVYRYALYKPAFLFTEYVNYFYQLKSRYKREGNKVFYEIVKLYLNSLYGKFGQRRRITEKIGEGLPLPDGAHIIYNSEGGPPLKGYVIDGDFYVTKVEGYSENSFPAIASFVAAYARCYLTELILKAGEGNVLYCDTDSLIVNEKGLKNLESHINGDMLGYLKHEDTADEVVIFGPKHYIFKKRVKIKGVPSSAVKIDDKHYKMRRWLRGRSLLRRGVLDRVIVEDFVKELKLIYDKGIVEKNGWVKPFTLAPRPSLSSFPEASSTVSTLLLVT
jgi:DNA polymerase elongation subunit (family B)